MIKNTIKSGLFLVMLWMVTACQEGENIASEQYGHLIVQASFGANAANLIISVDGEPADTLVASNPYAELILPVGKRVIELINIETEVVLSNDTIDLAVGQRFNLPKFLYTGDAALFEDLESRPAPDSMLVRFVNIDPELPEVIDVEIVLHDFAELRMPIKRLAGIRKDRFSNYIQLPSPYLFISEAQYPPGSVYYVIEAYDPNNDNNKVMSIEAYNYCYVYSGFGAGFEAYIPNAVISMGIATNFNMTIIFERLAQPAQ